MDQIAKERVALYRFIPPERLQLPILVTLVAVEKVTLEEEDI